jgi:ferredoxin-NADP reductase
MKYRAVLLFSEFVTHDVKHFIIERPKDFSFQPGQGVEMVIDQPQWRSEEGRPFTPTCLPHDQVLQFTIKRYAERQGVTNQLHTLRPGEALLLSEPFGTIKYQGKGTFIAAGAGITPFLAIFRDLAAKGELAGHSLLFSNKTPRDIICEKELKYYLGDQCLLTCTRESAPGYEQRRIDMKFLGETIRDFQQHFYVCGPDAFVEQINDSLQKLGARSESLIFEQ